MAERAIQALIAGDQQAFEALVTALGSSDNNQRSAAEAALTALRGHPDACASQLVRSLRSSPDPANRALCAVLLRKVLTRDEPSLWPGLSPAVRIAVRQEMLNCIKEEQMRSITKKVCDTVAELAAGTMEEAPGWPELLPFMFQCIQSNEARLMESALLIFAQLAHYVIGVLLQYMGTLHGVLQSALGHASMDVRIAAVKAATAFIRELENPVDRDKFQDVLPLLVQTIGFALNQGEEAAAQDAIELFIEVADEHPRFLRRQLADVVAAMLQIAESDTLDASTRQLAAEFLVTLCEAREKAPGMMRKLPQFGERLFKCLVLFLLDIEDEPEWHTAEDEKLESEGEGELYEFGQECLDRIALALGGNTVAAAAGVLLPQLIAAQGEEDSWKKRHAALITLAQIAEGCVKVMSKQLEPLVQLCLQGARDAHPKVRWASCQALGQLCTDLGPELQEEQHEKVLPALMTLMDDFQNPRVQAHACAAVVNFAETGDQDVIAPYLDALCQKLLALLRSGRRNVQEGALTALASVADCAQDYFDKYYSAAMPLLMQIMQHANDKAHAHMRAKALECASLVGMAVGKERFAADAAAIMQYMQAAQAAGLDPDDPLPSYMLQAGARICKTLGQDFLPYLPVVMPPLLQSAAQKPDVQVANAEDSDEEEEGGDVETFIVGDRKVSLSTSVLEEKGTACAMLCCYAEELGEGFYPYVEQVTQLMVPLLKFYFHDETRAAAAQSLPELLRSAHLAATKGLGPDMSFVRNMLAYMWGPLVDAVPKEPDRDSLNCLLHSAAELLDIAEGPALLPLEQAAALLEAFGTVLEEYEDRRKDRVERMASEDFDADEAEALEEEHEEENELLDEVNSCISSVLRWYGDAAMAPLERLMPAISKLLMDKGRYPEERRVAICVMDEVLEFSAAGAAKYAPQLLPLLLAGTADRDANIRQCCVYGLGICAKCRPEAFGPVAADAVRAIVSLLQAPDARSEDNECVFENAVSALGKVLEHAPRAVDASLAGLYLGALPLKADEDEARVVHEQLLRLVQASDPRILGPSNANLPKVVEVFVKVLAKGDRLVDPEAGRAMAVLLRQMQAALPPEVFNGFVAGLKPKQQATLEVVLAGAK